MDATLRVGCWLTEALSMSPKSRKGIGHLPANMGGYQHGNELSKDTCKCEVSSTWINQHFDGLIKHSNIIFDAKGRVQRDLAWSRRRNGFRLKIMREHYEGTTNLGWYTLNRWVYDGIWSILKQHCFFGVPTSGLQSESHHEHRVHRQNGKPTNIIRGLVKLDPFLLMQSPSIRA